MNDLLTSTTADGSILDVGTYTRIVEGFEENDYSGIAHFNFPTIRHYISL